LPSAQDLNSALADLRPEDRALVELSVVREMGDEEIASLVGLNVIAVSERRERAMAAVTEKLGEPPEPGRFGQADGDDPRLGRGKLRVWGLVLLALLLLVGITAGVVALSGGDDDSSGNEGNGGNHASQPPPARPKSPGPASAPVVPFRRLNDTHGRGTAQVVTRGGRARLRLRVQDLLRPHGGGYGVWIYSSGTRARQLLATRSTVIEADLPIPRDWKSYRFVDVSREVTSNPAYSGLTLLRTPTGTLAGRP
jgi:hypothetical protein